MSFLAGEMERQGLTVPLLIGGATTSRVHTAVKDRPELRSGPVVHVNDASRAVGVASACCRPNAARPTPPRCAPIMRKSPRRISAPRRQEAVEACWRAANAVKIDFAKTPPKQPALLGVKSFRDYDLAELAEYIDWTPFFQTWELTGRFPAILDDPKVGDGRPLAL